MIKSYPLLKTSIGKDRADGSLLMRSLEKPDRTNPRNHERLDCFLDLSNINRFDAANVIARVLEIMLKVRLDRKILIKNDFIRS